MSEIKLTEDELKKIQELNQEFTKTKLEIADNVLRQDLAKEALNNLKSAFAVEAKSFRRFKKCVWY